MKKIIIIILFAVIIIFVLDYISQKQKGYIYLIPKGYKGKLIIIFNQKNAPSLKKKMDILL